MTYYGLIARVVLQAGVVLALVLALATIGKVRRRPPKEAIIAAVAATVVGLALLLHAYWGWGVRGPLSQLEFILKRMAFLKAMMSDAFDYWEITNPRYYSGVLAYAFLLGAGAIFWTRLGWSRWIIILSSAVLIGLGILRAVVPVWSSRTYSLLVVLSYPELLTLGLAGAIAVLVSVFLCRPRTKTSLSKVQ